MFALHLLGVWSCFIVTVVNGVIVPGPTLYFANQPYYTGSGLNLTIAAEQSLAQTPWIKRDGALTYVSYDGNQICGANSIQGIYCADYTSSSNPTGPLSWRTVYGGLTTLDVWGSKIYGANSVQSVSAGNSRGAPNWAGFTGGILQVSYDGSNQMCGVNTRNEAFCGTTNIGPNPKWVGLPSPPSSFKNIEANAGRLYGISTSNQIYYKDSIDSTPWVEVPGVLKQISWDGQTVCGTAPGGEVFCANEGLPLAPKWMKKGGILLKQVVVWGNQLVGITNKAEIYTSDLAFTSCTNIPSDFDVHSYHVVGAYTCDVTTYHSGDCGGGGAGTLPKDHLGSENIVSPIYPIKSVKSCQPDEEFPSLPPAV